MDILTDVCRDCVIDTVKIIPFLYLMYLLMEYLEHSAGEKTIAMIRRADRVGPLWGGLLGIVPQCGFSAAAAGFYSGGVITAGTLIAVFLSTSDEMLPIMLSGKAPIGIIGHVLLCKALMGIFFGFVVDFLFRRFNVRKIGGNIRDICEHEHCGCEKENIFLSALRHSAQVIVFIVVISLIVNLAIAIAGEEALAGLILNRPVIGQFLAGLIGLIPNCAASVVITTLYMEGAMSGGAMMSGLLVGAGIGLLVLFRTNRRLKENLQLTGILYVCGVLGGLIVDALHIL